MTCTDCEYYETGTLRKACDRHKSVMVAIVMTREQRERLNELAKDTENVSKFVRLRCGVES